MNSPVSKSRDLGSLLKDPFTLTHNGILFVPIHLQIICANWQVMWPGGLLNFKLDTELQSNLSLRTPLYYRRFFWSQKCQKSYIPYLYNTDTSVKRTLCSGPLVSVERSLTVLSSCWSIYLNGAVFLFRELQFKATKSLVQSNGVFFSYFSSFSIHLAWSDWVSQIGGRCEEKWARKTATG